MDKLTKRIKYEIIPAQQGWHLAEYNKKNDVISIYKWVPIIAGEIDSLRRI